ncbi:hypothetical protein CL616_01215 [archaeon]|nr:hypothetical protein [archaeon]|tara:strand:+ start:430 stop:645 length:216 start_codon:yes stop_codon:yes gene_type:complete
MTSYLIKTRAGKFYEVLAKAEEWFINFKGAKKKVKALGENGQLEKGGRVYFHLREDKIMRTQPIVDIYKKL